MKCKVICWDGVTYKRETNKEEVNQMIKEGYCEITETEIVFNFSILGD